MRGETIAATLLLHARATLGRGATSQAIAKDYRGGFLLHFASLGRRPADLDALRQRRTCRQGRRGNQTHDRLSGRMAFGKAVSSSTAASTAATATRRPICRKNHPPSLWRAENDPLTEPHRALRAKIPMTMSPSQIELPTPVIDRVATASFDRNLVVTGGSGHRQNDVAGRSPGSFAAAQSPAAQNHRDRRPHLYQQSRRRNEASAASSALQAFLDVQLDREAANDAEAKTKSDAEALIALYQLSKDELDSRIHDALRNMERSDIGTIHSFAANLLRLYPPRSGRRPAIS